jgi:tetratricopeptide (TPR) repeat protein
MNCWINSSSTSRSVPRKYSWRERASMPTPVICQEPWECSSGAEDQYPDNVDLHYARATIAEEQGQLAAALRELKGVLALRPADPAALNAYGYTLADHSKHLGEARKLIEEAHAAAPKIRPFWIAWDGVLYRQGHGEQALPYLNEAFATIAAATSEHISARCCGISAAKTRQNVYGRMQVAAIRIPRS